MARLQHFGWFLGHGFGVQGWGREDYRWGYKWYRPELYQQSIRELEAAGLDLIIIKDDLRTTPKEELLELSVGTAHGGPRHDSLTLAPYLLSATENIGVLPSLNASVYPPFLAARQIASLFHLSNGRAGVNVVTSGVNPRDFGADSLPEHDLWYDRADEWVSVNKKLWTSWEKDAVIEDLESGIYADHRKVHRIDHEGAFFNVEGPLNTLPFADDGPVIAAPGGSPKGFWFAGKNADVQLAVGSTPEQITRTRGEIHKNAIANGRNPSEIKILFVLKPIIVPSAEEGERLRSRLANPSDDELRAQASGISFVLGIDFSKLDLDKPLPEEIVGRSKATGVLGNLLSGFDDPFAVPLRALLTKQGSGPGGGNGLVGTAEEIADHIEQIGEETGNDGFLFSGEGFDPVTVHRTLDELVPVLRRRGVLRTEYGGGNLRANLSDF